MNKEELQEITISVTEKDIVGATRYSPCNCPIAISIRRRIPILDSVFVHTDKIILKSFRKISYVEQLNTPEKAYQFMLSFDSYKDVRPIRFKITVRKEWLEKPKRQLITVPSTVLGSGS